MNYTENTVPEAPVSVLLKHRDRLFNFIKKRVSDFDLAEDILQDSLLKAFQKAPEEDEGKLLSWFFTVLRNAVIDSSRKLRSDGNRVESLINSLSLNYNDEDESEICECFNELLPAMKPEYRDMIENLELGNETAEGASLRLKINRNQLKVLRFRARQQLRKFIEESCRICAKHGCLNCTCS